MFTVAVKMSGLAFNWWLSILKLRNRILEKSGLGIFFTAASILVAHSGQCGQAWAAPADAGVSSSDANTADTVVSNNEGPAHEWTQEEMLLARPMPMSQEERDFNFKNKAPETIRSWTLGAFHEFTRSPLGRKELKNEGTRWVSIRKTLRQQVAYGKAFFANPKNFQTGKKSKSGESKVPKIDASAHADTEVFDDESFEAGESAATFDRLKVCRQDISDLCQAIDDMKKLAVRRGRLEEFEHALTIE